MPGEGGGSGRRDHDDVKEPQQRLRDPRVLAMVGAGAVAHLAAVTALLWPITNSDPAQLTAVGLALAVGLRHTVFRKPSTLHMCSLVGHCDHARGASAARWLSSSPRLEGAGLVFAGTLVAIPSICVGAATTGGALLWGAAMLGTAADGAGQVLATGELAGLGQICGSFICGSLFFVVGALPILPVGTCLAVVDLGSRLLLHEPGASR